jgi:glycine/D-amino acid oxidase-like deaminating enzyme
MAPIETQDSPPNNSLWAEGFRQSGKRKEFNNSYDVAIIGGGFSGLWSAYHLLELNPKLSIVIFEAKSIGYGASGRNGGWVSSDYPVYRKTLEKRHGIDSTNNLFKALFNAIDEIGEIARQIAPKASFVKSGTITFARNKAQERRLRQSADSEHIWRSASEISELIQVSDLRGGLFNPQCATINPFQLVLGLANYLEKKGVVIAEGVFATHTKQAVLAGSTLVKAPVVIRASEAFSDPGREFIPLYSLMIASEVLPDEIWDQIGVKDRFTFAEGTHLVNYAQRTADNRLAIGGRGASYPFGSKLKEEKEMTSSVHQSLERMAKRWFPVLNDVKFTHAWGGAVAITRNWEPYIQFDKASGYARLGGYAGDGLTMSYLASKILAELIVGRESEYTNLHLVNQKIRKWEIEPIRYLAVNSLVKLSGIADKEEARTARPSLISRLISPLILR